MPSRPGAYRGWWTIILESNNDASDTHPHDSRPVGSAAPIAESSVHIPTPGPPRHVILNSKIIPLPEKPPPPDNCCMSGCSHCVWDIYREDMEEYEEKRAELRRAFVDAGRRVPDELGGPCAANAVEEAMKNMDPGMRAFLEMERKLKGS